MDLVGQKIKHKKFHSGVITEFDGVYLTVQFLSKVCKFEYPDAFSTFIVAEDELVQAAILKEISDIEVEKIKLKEYEEEQSRLAQKRYLEELAKKTENNKKETAKKVGKRILREDGKRMTFFVFQGSTFDAEYRGGYIWAPKFNAAGNSCHHWDRLLDVREGDIIFHGVDGYIEAISIAKGACYDAESPKELKAEQLWENAGRRVDCDYMKIKYAIKTADYRDVIINFCGVKYAPFDKDGNGNMGYLFQINRELARFFVEKMAKRNGYILESSHVQELLLK